MVLASALICYNVLANPIIVPGYIMDVEGNCCMCKFTGNLEDRCNVSEQCCEGYHPGCDTGNCGGV